MSDLQRLFQRHTATPIPRDGSQCESQGLQSRARKLGPLNIVAATRGGPVSAPTSSVSASVRQRRLLPGDLPHALGNDDREAAEHAASFLLGDAWESDGEDNQN